MLYDLSNEFDRQRFITKVKTMLDKGGVVNLSNRGKRTLSQNAYMHLCISLVAFELGYRAEFIKEEYFKKLCNHDLFFTGETDKVSGKEIYKSSKELSIEDMSKAISAFVTWAATELQIYIPAPEDEARIQQAEIELGRVQQFL